MNILVTGCAGFIGTNLCKRLLERGHKVFGIDNFSYGYKKNMEDIEFEDYYNMDINELLPFPNIDIIYHQANLRKNISSQNPELDFETTILGTKKVLDYALMNNINRFVYASSSLVYGDGEAKETSEPNPVCIYGVSKVAAENLVKMYRRYGLRTCIFRYFQGFGPYQDNERGSAIIPTVIKNILNSEPITIYGTGHQTRSFTWIDDIVDILELPLLESCWGETYNVTAGKEIQIIEIVNMIIKCFQEMGMSVTSPIHFRDPKDDDAFSIHGDNSKIKELGVQFDLDLKKNLKKTIEFYKCK